VRKIVCTPEDDDDDDDDDDVLSPLPDDSIVVVGNQPMTTSPIRRVFDCSRLGTMPLLLCMSLCVFCIMQQINLSSASSRASVTGIPMNPGGWRACLKSVTWIHEICQDTGIPVTDADGTVRDVCLYVNRHLYVCLHAHVCVAQLSNCSLHSIVTAC